MTPDILIRRKSAFVLWRVANTIEPPVLVIGEYRPGTPIRFINQQRYWLTRDINHPDLWFIDAAICLLNDGWVYHYWFEISDAAADRPGLRISITDPMAYAVNWQLLADKPNDPHYTDADAYPAAVIKYNLGQLIPCDIGGEELPIPMEPDIRLLSPNNRLVIYELPTAWTKMGSAGQREIGTGSFTDAIALIDPNASGTNFDGLPLLQQGRSYLTELGVTALQLLPPADSFYKREWGYDTANFFAPDFDLGKPAAYSWSAANRDLQDLTAVCHVNGIRFFIDSVMAFSKQNPYLAAAPDDFFILNPAAAPDDPDAHNSRQPAALRNGFGSTLFRYAALNDSYDPISGQRKPLYPARQLMKTAILRWMNDFRIDGIRMDSIENIASWDFVQEYKDAAWQAWQQQHPATASDRFLVVGEELSEPLALLSTGRLDGLWHESFKKLIRYAITGQAAAPLGEPSFEWTVRKAIDARNLGFTDLSQAIIYLTSHDVEGYRNERLYNFLVTNGIPDTEKHIKLAFACLLTAVGIPMILAGEEFADQHDLFDQQGNVDQQGGKQVDPVNFYRIADDWRSRIRIYVSRLIACRTSNPALSVNDTDFIHVDFSDGKRVLVWQRGIQGSSDIVIVVANFSDYGTPDPADPDAEYIIPAWPMTPPGSIWHEATQDRIVGIGWAGREPIYPWEAKVYQLLPSAT